MKDRRIFDGRLLFKTYCEWGLAASHDLLVRFAKDTYGQGSQMGPYYSMWNWAFQNPEEAFEFWKEWYFHNHPDQPQPPEFSLFLEELRDRGARNKNVASPKEMARFCAKYNIEWNYRIEPNDVIQITRRDHKLFQALMVVDNIEKGIITAHFVAPDKVYPEVGGRELTYHEFIPREVGVIGKAIV